VVGHDHGVGILYDYFAAASDEAAAAMVNVEGGPAAGLWRNTPEALAARSRAGDPQARLLVSRYMVGLSDHGVYALSLKGVDPHGDMVLIEALLTGASEDEVRENPRAGRPVAIDDPNWDHEIGPWIYTITDELHAALSESTARQRADVALQWIDRSGPDYLRPSKQDIHRAETTAHILERLSELALVAREGNERLYCWLCL
jgi:hypothetical protein